MNKEPREKEERENNAKCNGHYVESAGARPSLGPIISSLPELFPYQSADTGSANKPATTNTCVVDVQQGSLT